MNKSKLKTIFSYLPLSIKMVCYSIYKALTLKKIYKSPDHFPLNLIENLDLPIFGKSSKVGYFYRHYQEKRILYNFVPENLFNYKYEIIYAEHRNASKIIDNIQTDSLVPVCLEEKNQSLIVKNNNSNQEDILKNIPEKRFHYFKVNNGESYEFSSDSNTDFLIGDPIALKQNKKNSKKLVLCIFIDGLADISQIDSFTEDDLMPNSKKFFSKGVSFKNNFSNAEWTLPSVPSFFSGGRQQFHGFYDPKFSHTIGKDFKILSEIFHDNEYLTFQANGNWRVSPSYGYIKGFDRTIYKKEMNINEVIHSFFEHLRTFSDRDNFVWLTLMDVHHLLNVIPDISSQKNNSTSAHCVTPWHDDNDDNKSVFLGYNKDLTEIYANEIKKVDFYLQSIYDYIDKNYTDDEFVVSLVSDHGHSFLTNDSNPLSIARTKVPWMIRGGGIPCGDSFELTENIDFFNSIIECSGLNMKNNSSESMLPAILGGKENREFVVSQSIYPGQTYKAIIRNKLFEYEFESANLISASGKITGDLIFKRSRPLDSSTIIHDKPNNISNYKKFVELKISDWNISQLSQIKESA
jgi:hypothetical protein